MNRLYSALAVLACLAAMAAGAQAPEEQEQPGPAPAPEDAQVYLIAPSGGAATLGAITVVIGLRGMGIAPAGVRHENTGHFHLVVDGEPPPPDEPIPDDDRHIHLDGGETQTMLELEPGSHTVQVIFADHRHIPHEPPLMSEKVTFEVLQVQ
jgi:hypothetical protein